MEFVGRVFLGIIGIMLIVWTFMAGVMGTVWVYNWATQYVDPNAVWTLVAVIICIVAFSDYSVHARK